MDLLSLRNEINRIDGELTELLLERFELAKNVARYKKANGVPVFDAEREQEILDKAQDDGGKELKAVYSAILEASKNIQNDIIGK